jgi:glyoxylase-like metal-dependent hydrolase (beta-lactamase superfamily II)
VEEFKNTTQLAPNVVFDDTLDIDLGDRQVQIWHLGPGNTAGDTIVFLPAEKILVTGDLVVHPIPYFFGGFPADFPRTLRALAQIEARTIVPGHGEVLRGKDYIFRVAELLETVNLLIEKEINEGRTLEEAGQSVPGSPDVRAWRRKFAGGDVDEGEFFDTTVEALVKAAYNQIKMR